MRLPELLFAGFLTVGALATGLLALVNPEQAGRAFGLPPAGPGAYMRAIGARNLALGLILLALFLREDRPAIAAVAGALSLTAGIDAALTYRRGLSLAFCAHLAGLCSLAAYSAWLIASA